MADDSIDIEEHDILDNPVIRRIFPDISVLKQEIIDFHDGVEVLNENETPNNCIQLKAKKCSAVRIDSSNRTLPNPPSKISHDFVNTKFIESICTQLDESQKYPTIVIDENNDTSSCLIRDIADKSIHATFTHNKFRQLDRIETYPKIEIDETIVNMPWQSNESAGQSSKARLTESICTQVDAEKYPTIIIDDTESTSSCLTSELANLATDNTNYNFMEINETKKYPVTLNGIPNISLSRLSSKPADKCFVAKLPDDLFIEMNDIKKESTITVDEIKMANDEIDIEEHNIFDNPVIGRIFPDISVLKKEVVDFDDKVFNKEISFGGITKRKTEKRPTKMMDISNEISPNLSSKSHKFDNTKSMDFIGIPVNELQKTANVIDENNVSSLCLQKSITDKSIDAKFTDNNLTQFKEMAKYSTLVIEETDMSVPCCSNESRDLLLDVRVTENICTKIADPTIIIDDTETTPLCPVSKLGNKVIDYNNTENIPKEKKLIKNYSTTMDKTSVTVTSYSKNDKKLGKNLKRVIFTQTDEAKKDSKTDTDKSNVTSSSHSSNLQQVTNAVLTRNNIAQLNESNKNLRTLSENSNMYFQTLLKGAADKILANKFTENNYRQINEAEKYNITIGETNETLSYRSSEPAFQDASVIETYKRHQNCDNKFENRMEMQKMAGIQEIDKEEVEKNEQKSAGESFNSTNVTSKASENQIAINNVKLNHWKLPKNLQKIVTLPKHVSKHSLNMKKTVPQLSKQGKSNTPLSVISNSKSSSYFLNNSSLEHTNWKGNKIILGSKPSVIKSENKACGKQNISDSVRVLVENLSTFLGKCSRFCKTCRILFPSKKELADHRNLIHSQSNNTLLGRSNNIIRNTNKSLNNKCDFCSKVFSSSSILIRHKICVHSVQDKKKKSKSNLKKQMQPQSYVKFVEKTNFKCSHCNNSFSSQQSLIDHMYNVLQSKTNDNVKKPMEYRSIKLHPEKKPKKNRLLYRCAFCSFYFTQKNTYIKHLKTKHNITDKICLKKVVFDPMCKYCRNKYFNIHSFNIHVWKLHLTRLNKASKITNNKEKKQCKSNYNRGDKNEVTELDKDKNICKKYLLRSVFFKCVKCNVCFLSGKEAANHTIHDKISTFFKCSKCSNIFKKEEYDIHAQQHSFSNSFEVFEISEKTYLYLLLKCPNCTTYFRENDFFYHYSVCEFRPPDSAYCKTCHILIDNQIKELHDLHHKMAGSKELNNILVETDVIIRDDDVKETYELPKESEENKSIKMYNEKNDIIMGTSTNIKKSLQENNLIPSVVELDEDKEEKNKRDIRETNLSVNRKTIIIRRPTRFIYCNACKTFIFVSKVRKLYNHIKKQCLNLTNYVCKYCGLVLSNKNIESHRKLHRNEPNVTLNDFLFHDLNTGKRICPPIPKYPHCHLCKKHFITKTATISHVCSEGSLKCPSCNIKLSKTAFPLHMSFHNYSSKFDIEIPSEASEIIHPTPDLTNSINKNKNSGDKYLLVYVCKICKVAVDTYDEVIEHCHYHISSGGKEILTKPCDLCNLIFDDACFNNHRMLHSRSQNKNFSVLTFDAFYVTAEDKVWFNHLFGLLSKKDIDNILKYSIYSVERKIKMHVIEDGLSPDLILYKCAKCNSFVDPLSLRDHFGTDAICYKSKVTPCPICGILFMSEDFLIKHKQIHEIRNITARSYKVVLFNCDDDKIINHTLNMPRQYVLYECRNCNGIIDKKQFSHHKCDFEDLSKCSHCGLLLYNVDYMSHVVKHKEFCSFQESNIVVILLGVVKDAEILNNRYIPSFRGIILDYLVYKCNKCQVCLKDKQSFLTHDCVEDIAKTKCLLCDLYFEDNLFKSHRKMHECDTYYSKENVTVVDVGLECLRPSDLDVIVIEDEEEVPQNKDDNTLKDEKLKNTNQNNAATGNFVEKCDKIFKCPCGLHFLTEASALSHCNSNKCNNRKSMKQKCPKCDFTFKPNILYSHLLKHHGSRKVSYKFDIIHISKPLSGDL